LTGLIFSSSVTKLIAPDSIYAFQYFLFFGKLLLQPFYGSLDFVQYYRVSQYQKSKNRSGFTGARDSEWQWHQLGLMQIFTSPQTDNHASIPPLSFLQAECPSCHQTNSIQALKASY